MAADSIKTKKNVSSSLAGNVSTVEQKPTVALSEQTQGELAALHEINGLLNRISENNDKILSYRKSVKACQERTAAVDREVEDAYRKHVEIKGTYNTTRAEQSKSKLDLLSEKCVSKANKSRVMMFKIITAILVLLSIIVAFVATNDFEMDVVFITTVIKVVMMICVFAIMSCDEPPKFSPEEKKNTKPRVSAFTIVIIALSVLFCFASYVRMDEDMMGYAVFVDIVCAAMVLIFCRISNAPYRAFAKLEKKYPEFVKLDQAEEAKKNEEITAGLASVVNNVYPDVEEIKKKYLAIRKDTRAFISTINELKADNVALQQKLDGITLLVNEDKNPVLVSQVINWLECGKVSSLKQALREWDYETEAKALQEDYFQCQINITAEMAEIDYDINRINERILSHAQKVRSNINEIEETVEQFKRDVNEKY